MEGEHTTSNSSSGCSRIGAEVEDLPIVEELAEANDVLAYQLVVGGDDGVLVDDPTGEVELVYIQWSKQYSFWQEEGERIGERQEERQR